MKKHLLYSLVIIIISFKHIQAMSQQSRRASINFGVQVAQPLGQFADVYDGYPAGFSCSFSSPLSNTPFEIGAAFAWNGMGSQQEDISAYIGTDSDGDSIYESGNMNIRNNSQRYLVLGRLRPFNGMIQPYADGLMGLEIYKTKTDITLNDNGYSEAISSVRQHFDMTYNYGYAIGLRVRIAPNIFIDGRFENLIGGPSKYVNQETIQVIDDVNITFETLESKTDKYTFQLGLAIGF